MSCQKLIFITGASRSGTTLMSFVLRNHARIFGLKELHYFGDHWDPRDAEKSLGESELKAALASIFARQEQGILAARPSDENVRQANEFFAQIPVEDRTPAGVFMAAVCKYATEAGKDIPCEQTPRNIFYAEALLREFPDAHVVHMLRDPRAVMASQKNRWQRRKLATDKSAFPRRQSLRVWVNYHPYTVAKLWSKATREAFRLQDNPRFTLIRFEDLLQQPEPTVRQLCERIGVAFDPAMLEVGQINSSHQSSVGGARKGLHTEAIDKWKSILASGEAAIADRICGPLMDKAAYQVDSSTAQHSESELRYKLTYLLHVGGVLLVNPRRAWIQLQAAMKSPAGRQSA